jgi:hypothetical protein
VNGEFSIEIKTNFNPVSCLVIIYGLTIPVPLEESVTPPLLRIEFIVAFGARTGSPIIIIGRTFQFFVDAVYFESIIKHEFMRAV